jgi:pre-rRNA-processing protein IPI1
MPVTPAPFAHLQLYAKEITQKTTEKTDLTSISCEDFETRRKVFLEHFSQQVLKNIATLVKEGGEVGKSAKAVQALVESLIKENDTKEE